ncbi:MAG: ATP-binding protein [Prevotellaceae bacterium]|nr:ATP-binding protein [Prevotellaceae bacterium]
MQNAISAGAGLITVCITENEADDRLVISIADNGRGMTPEEAARATDPYFTSRRTRKVGLGLPLFKQSAEQSGGALTVVSAAGKGTTVTATFGLCHIDRPALGDTANAVMLSVAANPHVDFIYTHDYNHRQYTFDTREVKAALDGLPIHNPQMVLWLTDMIRENVKAIRSSESSSRQSLKSRCGGNYE